MDTLYKVGLATLIGLIGLLLLLGSAPVGCTHIPTEDPCGYEVSRICKFYIMNKTPITGVFELVETGEAGSIGPGWNKISDGLLPGEYTLRVRLANGEQFQEMIRITEEDVKKCRQNDEGEGSVIYGILEVD